MSKALKREATLDGIRPAKRQKPYLTWIQEMATVLHKLFGAYDLPPAECLSLLMTYFVECTSLDVVLLKPAEVFVFDGDFSGIQVICIPTSSAHPNSGLYSFLVMRRVNESYLITYLTFDNETNSEKCRDLIVNVITMPEETPHDMTIIFLNSSWPLVDRFFLMHLFCELSMQNPEHDEELLTHENALALQRAQFDRFLELLPQKTIDEQRFKKSDHRCRLRIDQNYREKCIFCSELSSEKSTALAGYPCKSCVSIIKQLTKHEKGLLPWTLDKPKSKFHSFKDFRLAFPAGNYDQCALCQHCDRPSLPDTAVCICLLCYEQLKLFGSSYRNPIVESEQFKPTPFLSDSALKAADFWASLQVIDAIQTHWKPTWPVKSWKEPLELLNTYSNGELCEELCKAKCDLPVYSPNLKRTISVLFRFIPKLLDAKEKRTFFHGTGVQQAAIVAQCQSNQRSYLFLSRYIRDAYQKSPIDFLVMKSIIAE